LKARTGLGFGLVVLGSAGLIHCGRQAPGPVERPAVQKLGLAAWRWHLVGGLLVVEGELDQPAVVTLKGQTLDQTVRLPLGPVRWELYRPPPGEVADLRSADGRLLAHWVFDAPADQVTASEPAAVPPLAPSHPGTPSVTPPVKLAAVPAPLSVQQLVHPVTPPVQQPAHPVLPPVLPSVKSFATPPAKPAAVPVPPAVQQPAHPVLPPVLPSVESSATPPAKPAAVPAAPPARPSTLPSPPTVQASLQPSIHPLPSPVTPSTRPVGVPPPAPVPAAAPGVPGAPLAEAGATAWPGAGEAMYLLRGPRGGRRICMTFDGGSTAEVAGDVLDVLKAHGIHTTLFLTGDFIRRFPALVLRIVQDGHEVGNHTQTHPHMAPHYQRDPRWTRERMQQELLDADRAFFRLTGRPMDPYWRPPFGEQTAELRRWAEELGYRTVGWSEGADTLDWTTVKEFNLYRNGSATIARLEKRMGKADGDGLIVLMHLGSLRPAADRPAKYLGPFMDRAMRDGWHFVSVGDYLQAMGRPRWDAARRVVLLKALDAPEAPEAGSADRGVNASAP